MKIAAAQINCTLGAIQQNLDTHYQLIEAAIKEKVALISFPEMSITGYCRAEGSALAFIEGDSRLEHLRTLSQRGNIIIIAGAPIKINKDLFIGAFVMYPNKSIDIYTKQFLHDGEDLFYTASTNYNPIIRLAEESISLAICADISNEQHPFQAKKINSTLYLPSIFYSERGMNEGLEQLKYYAEKYAMNILSSNFTGVIWDLKAGGKSSFWNTQGEQVAQLGAEDSGLLIAEKENEKWEAYSLLMAMENRY